MIQILEYLLRLSICFSIMYLFYSLLLKKFTFNQYNRWYLLGYSLLCFIIPVVNIGTLTANPQQVVPMSTVQSTIISRIPQVSIPDKTLTAISDSFSYLNLIIWIISLGILLMSLRLLIQYIAIMRLKKKATVIATERAFTLYQVDSPIAPFSFGNSIYINQNLHQAPELEKILAHEMVHIKQRHTLDILWAELLCILNWYNPFVWLIRRSIKENLEYIADAKVIEGGIDKQQYQYLLLKEMNTNHYLLTNQFNFSSLKNRITMMNKVKTAKIQLLKFLFLLPLIGLLLASFRSAIQSDASKVQIYGIVINESNGGPLSDAIVIDSINHLKAVTNSKGYYRLSIPTAAALKLPVILKVKKAGFTTVSLPINDLQDNKNGKTNSLYTINAAMQPAGNRSAEPVKVIVGYQEGTDGYRQTKSYWDSISTTEQLSKTTITNKKLTLAGIVVDQNNYQPLKGVILKSEADGTEAKTNSRGFYSLPIKASIANSRSINLKIVKAGYAHRTFHYTLAEHDTNNLIVNFGITPLTDKSSVLISFSQLKGQSITNLYEDAYNLLKGDQQKWQTLKKMEHIQKVIKVQNKDVYILGNNISSTYTVSEQQKYSVNGRQMSIAQINNTYQPKNITNISANTPDDINLTANK